MSKPRARIPSLVKKYVMAVTGLVLVLFVLGHMLGNLQIFAGTPLTINKYAFFLHSLGEWLWLIRFFLLACVTAHIWMAVLLARENRRARPRGYQVEVSRQASYAARTMLMSGLIVLAFLLFHLAHFTLQTIFPIYGSLEFPINGQRAHDVYAMMILGFAEPVVSAFYLVSLGLLCLHLTHGFSSMFQSVGLRNEKWRGRLNGAARAFGLLIFLGFAVIPVAVLVSKYTALQWLPVRAIVEQVAQNQETWDPNQPTPIYVDYQQTPLGLSNTDFGPGGDNH